MFVAIGFVIGGGAVLKFIAQPRIAPNGITIIGLPQHTATPPEDMDVSPLWRALQIIEERYVARGDIDRQKLLEGAIRGLVGALDDPYSVFLTPKEEKEFEETILGRFEGIGVEIGIRDEILTIIAPVAGTPAQAAGLRSRDQILAIDGESTKGIAIEEAVSRIRGKGGTVVKLTVARKNWQEPREFYITRATIRVPSVTLEFPEQGIAHLKIHNFHARALFEFRNAVRQILHTDANRIIVDLRNNTGGYLDHAIEIAGWFLERGDAVVKIDEGGGPVICEFCTAAGNALFADPKYKIVVLVNEGSASAAEILAGALRDNLNIKIIGATTFGKGFVQEFLSVNGAGAIKITTAKWFTPKGTDISKNKIEPDIKIESPLNEEEKDLQLKEALRVVKSL